MGTWMAVGPLVILLSISGCGGGRGGEGETPARTSARNVLATPVSPGAVLISWTETSPGGAGYSIQRASAVEGPFAEVERAGAGVTSCVHPAGADGKKYYYRVVSLTPSEDAVPAAAEGVEMPAPADLPSIPNNLKAKAVNSSSVRLSWRDTSENETGFVIERVDGLSPVEVAVTPPNAQEFVVVGLDAYSTYPFQVRAVNADGHSRPSETVLATTLGEPDSIVERVSVSEGFPDGPAIPVRSVLAFDGEGRLIRLERDDGNDGAVEVAMAYSYRLEDGRLMQEMDRDGDGSPDVWKAFNEAGDEVAWGTGDGPRGFNHFDELGYLVRTEADTDADPGNPFNLVEVPFRGARGEVVRTELDDDGDGVPYGIGTWTYDERLNPLVETWVEDWDNDGVPNRVVRTLFRATGERVRLEIDSDGDGALDHTETTSYYADGSSRVRAEFNDDDEGLVDRVYVSVWSSEPSQMMFESSDLNGDGNPEERVTRTYHPNGVPSMMLVECDADSDGLVESSERYLYDENGAVIGVEIDSNGDGVPD